MNAETTSLETGTGNATAQKAVSGLRGTSATQGRWGYTKREKAKHNRLMVLANSASKLTATERLLRRFLSVFSRGSRRKYLRSEFKAIGRHYGMSWKWARSKVYNQHAPPDKAGFIQWKQNRELALAEGRKRKREATQARVKALRLFRYRNDPEFRNRWRAQEKARRSLRREETNRKWREKYHSDPKVKEGYKLRRRITLLDPAERIKKNLRNRLYVLVRREKKAVKFKSAVKLVGCSVPELLIHLESRFKRGMTWKNYGPVWHVDHILPCTSFDLMKEDEQRRCFHFLNLQPLFAKENISKSNRILPAQIPLGI